MSKEQINQQAQNIVEQGKAIVAEGNQRHLVLHKQDGTEIFATSLTVATAVGVVLLVSGFLTWPIVLIAALVAYRTKVRLALRPVNATVTEE